MHIPLALRYPPRRIQTKIIAILSMNKKKVASQNTKCTIETNSQNNTLSHQIDLTLTSAKFVRHPSLMLQLLFNRFKEAERESWAEGVLLTSLPNAIRPPKTVKRCVSKGEYFEKNRRLTNCNSNHSSFHCWYHCLRNLPEVQKKICSDVIHFRHCSYRAIWAREIINNVRDR
jgi:hypothetical protein